MAFRLGDAFGAQEIWLTGTTPAPPNRKLSKTARNTERSLLFQRETNTRMAIQSLKEMGFAILVLELTNQSEDIRKVDFQRFEKIALVVGAENEGVSEATLAVADQLIQLPMYGENSSMNVSNALAIGLYEVVRQWDKGG